MWRSLMIGVLAMKPAIRKFALVALCTTALTAVSQTSQAAILFDITGVPVTAFSYGGAGSADNVVNDTTWSALQQTTLATGSTVYDGSATADWKGSTSTINSVLSVSGLDANQQYTVAFTYAGSEAGDANKFSVANAGNVVNNGAIGTSTTGALHNLNSNSAGNPQVGPTVSMGSVLYQNTGAGGNIPGFTLTDTFKNAVFPANTTTNGGSNAVPNTGASNLIFSYATFDGTNYTLSTRPSLFVVFAFNDNGSGDDNHDDFVGIAALVACGGCGDNITPIPAALPLFGSVLGGGYLFSKWRRKRKNAAA